MGEEICQGRRAVNIVDLKYFDIALFESSVASGCFVAFHLFPTLTANFHGMFRQTPELKLALAATATFAFVGFWIYGYGAVCAH